MASDITPFTIDVDDAVLSDLEARLKRLRWPGQPDDAVWQYGANLAYMRKLMAYWRDGFDWRQAEAGLNRWPQFRAPVAGADGDNLELHFIHEKSDYRAAPALLIVHGWRHIARPRRPADRASAAAAQSAEQPPPARRRNRSR